MPLFWVLFSYVVNEFLEAVEFYFIHLFHHSPQFSFRKAFLLEPDIVILRDVNQIKVFVFTKRHFIMGELDEVFRVGVQGVSCFASHSSLRSCQVSRFCYAQFAGYYLVFCLSRIVLRLYFIDFFFKILLRLGGLFIWEFNSSTSPVF